MSRNAKDAQELIEQIAHCVNKLVLVMPGINCDIVQKSIKEMRNNISILNTEAENHG